MLIKLLAKASIGKVSVKAGRDVAKHLKWGGGGGGRRI